MDTSKWSCAAYPPLSLCYKLPFPSILTDTLQKAMKNAFAEDSAEVLEECFGHRGELAAMLAKAPADPDSVAQRAAQYVPFVLGLSLSIPPKAPYTCTWRTGLGQNKTAIPGTLEFERSMVLMTQALAMHNSAVSMVESMPPAASAAYDETYKAAAKQLMTGASIISHTVMGLSRGEGVIQIVAEVNSAVMESLQHMFNAEAHIMSLTMALSKGLSLRVISNVCAHIHHQLQLAAATLQACKGQPHEVDPALVFHLDSVSWIFAVMSRRMSATDAHANANFPDALGHLAVAQKDVERMRTARKNAAGTFQSWLSPAVLAVMDTEIAALAALDKLVTDQNHVIANARPNTDVPPPTPSAVLKLGEYESPEPAFTTLTLKENGSLCSLQ